MSTTAITSAQTNALSGRTANAKHPAPAPPPTRVEEGDTLQLSAEALQQSPTAVPEEVLAAVADLQGSQISMGADFRTIGDYFAQNGGREVQDAFMAANFTQAQLRAFPPPVDGLRIDPVAEGLPDSVTAAVSDLVGDQSTVAEDISTIGDYFKIHGGKRALHALLEDLFRNEDGQAKKGLGGTSAAEPVTEADSGVQSVEMETINTDVNLGSRLGLST